MLLLLSAQPSPACGPYFPNNLLDRGDAALFDVPVAAFADELARMNLVPSRLQAVQTTRDLPEQTQDAELNDLAAALKKAKCPPEAAARVIAGHRVQRDKLRQFVAESESRPARADWMPLEGERREADADPPPRELPRAGCVEGLPEEFADYFDGARAWHDPAATDKALARAAWERVLALPAAERKFKSTWAAFMLGKSWEQEDPDQALEYFQQVRELAKQGFADSLGLAAASLGLEARIHLREERFDRALELYLEQFSTGDSTALNSLRVAGDRALNQVEPAVLAQLVKQPKTRRVLTALLVSARPPGDHESDADAGTAQRWLAAAEAANVRDLDSAEKLALAAYQAGDFEAAQRWIKRAAESPVAQWLQAKLLLRAGKVEPAAALLAKISRSFPSEAAADSPPASFAECLRVCTEEDQAQHTTAGRQIQGELGALRLARRQFTEALDALLRSGYWMDAAYVAERVLTVGELKRYVDREWPPVAQVSQPAVSPISKSADAASTHGPQVWKPATQQTWQSASQAEGEAGAEAKRSDPVLRRDIRYLLARRLTRLNRGSEAREYFPPEWQPAHDALMQSLTQGWDDTQAASQRAAALYAAAFITRTNGLELLGTEVGPDWAVHGGNFEEGVTAAVRTNADFNLLRASADELRRAFAHTADPETRFHYRYQAAFLAGEAAKLMPDNSDETARVLCTAGSWLKNRDPETADLFYKALVRRCRQTAIGDQADRRRWFPVLDDHGNPTPWEPKAKPTESPTAESALEPLEPVPGSLPPAPEPGCEYVVLAGDTLGAITQACAERGIPVTREELLQANPGLDPARLLIGQKIFIPVARPAEIQPSLSE